MRLKLLAGAGLILIFLVLLISCQTQPAANNGKKSIVVTYSILGSLVKDLVGNQAVVTVSVPNGLDPHDWEPSAKDIVAINKADMVVQNGLGLEGGMEKALGTAADNRVKCFTASDHISIRHVGKGEGIPSGDPDQTLGAADPHLWTDPITLISVIRSMSDELKTELNLDVTSQATDLENRLDILNKQITDTLAAIPQADRKLVTGHESMGYFAQRYNFKLVGVIVPSLNSQAEVSAASLADLKVAILENQVKAIFTELGTSPAVAAAIGKETGVKVIELNTHSLPSDGSYFTFMRNMSNIIFDALK